MNAFRDATFQAAAASGRPVKCAHTGVPLARSSKSSHVDHAHPKTFYNLALAWCAEQNIEWPEGVA